MKNYPKGSEWRRWDLHVHTPGTKLSDAYSGHDDDMEEFVRQIEACSAEVIGITDYFSIDTYESFINKFNELYPSSDKVFFPNVEFRLSETIGDHGTQPDLHVIFDDNDSECSIKKVHQFLGQLKLYNKGEDGQVLYCSGLETKSDFEAASVTKSDILASLETTFGQRKPYLIAFPAGNDGVKSTDTRSPKNINISDELDKSSDLFFGKTTSRDYFLKTDRYKNGISKPKPVVSGSDAHSFEDLKRINEQQENFEFTWIKADPTFEGLKQILYEPEDRVWIGLKPPDNRDPQRILCKMEATNTPDWLNWPTELELNPGLVCIIGNKGSGKTALLDTLAYAGGGYDSENDKSFLSKAKDSIQKAEMTTQLSWKNGDVNSLIYLLRNETLIDTKVTYLSQQFVEELCEINSQDKLNSEIEKVIYDKTPEDHRLGASNFRELREKRITSLLELRKEKERNLNDAVTKWCGFVEKIQNLDELRARDDRLSKELLNIKIPSLKEGDMQTVADEINRLTKLLSEHQRVLAEKGAQLQELENIKNNVERQSASHVAFFDAIQDTLNPLGFSEDEIKHFRIKFAGDPLSIIEKKKTAIQNEIGERTGVDNSDSEETLNGTSKKLTELQNELNVDQAVRQQIFTNQGRIAEIEQAQANIKARRTEIETEAKGIEIYKEKIFDAYKELLETFDKEAEIDVELYKPLAEEIGKAKTPFDVDVKRNVDEKSWKAEILNCIDGRSGAEIEDGIDKILNELSSAWAGGDREKCATLLCNLIQEISAWEDSPKEIFRLFRKDVTYVKFLLSIFDVAHINVNYSLKYNSLPLDSMSPGTKGLALLTLYLQLNEHDRRPLLVDQPEENLDNQSIYDNLRIFFRDVKKRRQIIMVTHNPNLVVNTDADQIIVTKITENEEGEVPTLSVSSGAIENPKIREKICDILEGGTEAFKTREDRYEL